MKILPALLIPPLLLLSASKVEWKIGKVLDSGTAKTYVATGSTTSSTATPNGRDVDVSSTTVIHSMTVKDTQLLIVGDEFAYVVTDTRASGGGGGLVGITSRAVTNRHHGCRFIVGDDVKFYQDKAILHVIDVDGKECKAEVVRQERLKPKP
jgi:hypothetical protein